MEGEGGRDRARDRQTDILVPALLAQFLPLFSLIFEDLVDLVGCDTGVTLE